MSRTTTRYEGWIAGVVLMQALTLSCSNSFEAEPQTEKLDKGGSEIQLVQTERKLRASGCAFELKPAASRLADEKLTCAFDMKMQGASAVADTISLFARLDAQGAAIRQHLEITGSGLKTDRREQLEHRLLLIADAKGDLKADLARLFDEEARVRLTISSLGNSGCEVVGTSLSCEEAVDLAHATRQIELLKRAEESIATLHEGHGPVLKTSLADYREISSALASRRVRLEDGVKKDKVSGALGIKIPGEGTTALKNAISIDGGLFVSTAQTASVAKTIDGIAALIAQNGWAKDLREKAYRRVVLTPLVSEPVDVDFESLNRTVYLPDTIKARDALEFLRTAAAPKSAREAKLQADGLAKLESTVKAMKDSGDLGSTGLVVEDSIARKWSLAQMAHEKVRAALEGLKADGKWTDSVKTSVRVVAADRFAVYGEADMTVVVNANESVDTIARELREALATRDVSISRLRAL